jgi:quercetin dioxygenase-like cupin family protein
MPYVLRIDPATRATPRLYQNHSQGFRRSIYVDRASGSVHMGVGVCFLDPVGEIQPHLHSFEQSFYMLEGNLTVYLIVGGRVRATADGKVYDLGPGDVIWTGVGCIHTSKMLEPSRCGGSRPKLPCLRRKKFFALSATGHNSNRSS